jgi:hypothetical protein
MRKTKEIQSGIYESLTRSHDACHHPMLFPSSLSRYMGAEANNVKHLGYSAYTAHLCGKRTAALQSQNVIPQDHMAHQDLTLYPSECGWCKLDPTPSRHFMHEIVWLCHTLAPA